MTTASPQEYSYFQAAGLTLAATSVVAAAQEDLLAFRDELKDRFGAHGIITTDTDGQFGISAFLFRTENVPDGWVQIDPPDPRIHTSVINPLYSYMPKPGSSDHFTLLAHAGRGTRALSNATLEKFFDLPEMPPRELEMGFCSNRFVRDKTWIGGFRPYIGAPQTPANHGYYAEPGRTNGNSTVRHSLPDPITFRDYNGAVYVRVPNDVQGRPRWTPPDSTPAIYEDVLKADNAQYRREHGQAKSHCFGV